MNFLPEVQFYKVRIFVPEQNCTGLEHNQIIVYDGPYAGVLTPNGLLSPYSVLIQGGCHSIANMTASISVGDISVVWLSSERTDYQLQVDFSTTLSSCGDDEFCSALTVQTDSVHTNGLTLRNKEIPSVQAFTFHVTNPNHNIHLKFEVYKSIFVDVGEFCEYGIIKIIEIQSVRAFYCSKDALRMLNQSRNFGGFQFNNRNITIVLKTYPQSAKLNMTITSRATYRYGLFNLNPVAESPQWFSSDALRPGMRCFHEMKLTESPFDGIALNVIPSNDFSCEIQVTEGYSDHNHELPIPKQVSIIIQYPPYQQASVDIKSMHVHVEHSGPQPVPNCTFEPWFDYTGNIIDLLYYSNVPYAFSTSRADLTFYRGCLYTQASFFAVIKSGAAVCFEVQTAQANVLYFEADAFCGQVTMLKSHGFIIFNSMDLVTGRNGSRCCVGFVQIKPKVFPMEHNQHATAKIRICPNGGEFCKSELEYKLYPAVIHAIDMTQINRDYVYEVDVDLIALSYEIEFKYKISLMLNTQQWIGSAYTQGVASVTFNRCYGQSCYMFWLERRSRSWNQANELCSGANMSLISINTDTEWQQVLQAFWKEDLLFTFIHLGFKEPIVSICSQKDDISSVNWSM